VCRYHKLKYVDTVQLWEDEPSTEELSSAAVVSAGNHTAANGAAGDTSVPDDEAELVSSSLVAESEGLEVGECDADPAVGVEDTVEHATDESENRQQECLISLDDDADVSGPAADEDTEECHIEEHEGHIEGNISSDDVASDDPTSTGKL